MGESEENGRGLMYGASLWDCAAQVKLTCDESLAIPFL